MPNFIKLSDEDRKQLFTKVKKNINSPWDNFYPLLSISRSMFFNYLSGRYNIPEKIFFRLESLSDLKIKNFERVVQNKFVKKDMQKPKMSKELAEIFGVLNGDGHIAKHNYEVCVVLSIFEKDYAMYLKNLFETVFGIEFKLNLQETKLKLRVFSKDLSFFLVENYSFPKGNKIGNLTIHPKISNSRGFSISYLRGLFDTDGSFYLRRKKDPVLSITSADISFLNQVRDLLELFDFNVSRGNKRLFIYNKEDIKRFFKLIKPANSKHLKKYQNYLKLSVDGLRA